MSDIYLDSDGVIANWTKMVCKITGAIYPVNTKIIPYALDAQLTRQQVEEAHYPVKFWVELEPFPWTKELVDLVNTTCPRWRILTRACNSPYSYTGKALWIEKHFPKHAERLVICRGSKRFACKSGDILIDDHPKNIDEWNQQGGHGFLWHELSEDYDYSQQFNDLKQFILEFYKV